MKILQIAPIYLPISDSLYCGGTERVINTLDTEFTEIGLDSIVAATANSNVRGRLWSTIEEHLWSHGLEKESADDSKKIERHYQRILKYLSKEEVDIIHDQSLGFIISKSYQEVKDRLNTPILSTLHSVEDPRTRKTLKYLEKNRNGKLHINSMSKSQKDDFLKIVDIDLPIIYNGVKINSRDRLCKKRNYLLSLGRITPIKGQEIAIRVAKRLNKLLIIAGDVVNEGYWETEIKPHLDECYKNVSEEKIGGFIHDLEKRKNKGVIYIGKVNNKQKKRWYSYAKGFLMTSKAKEICPLVVLESMLYGTPVIGFNNGAIPELIKNNESGYIVKDVEEMCKGVRRLGKLNPLKCREYVINNFSSRIQANNYLNLYQIILERARNES